MSNLATIGTMKKLTISLLISITAVLIGCGSTEAADPKSIISVAKDNMKKAGKYHDLANKAKVAQAELQNFVAGWVEECKVKGYQLQMGQDGDPGCISPQSTPPAPQASTPQVPKPPSPAAPPPQK